MEFITRFISQRCVGFGTDGERMLTFFEARALFSDGVIRSVYSYRSSGDNNITHTSWSCEKQSAWTLLETLHEQNT